MALTNGRNCNFTKFLFFYSIPSEEQCLLVYLQTKYRKEVREKIYKVQNCCISTIRIRRKGNENKYSNSNKYVRTKYEIQNKNTNVFSTWMNSFLLSLIKIENKWKYYVYANKSTKLKKGEKWKSK